jgi:hypothetical protein
MSSFEARRALSVCLAAAVSLGAFGCNSDDEFVEPEVTSDNHEEMLSAAPGPGEKLGKADDLRDSEPAYMFTGEPSDVDVLPAEFDTAQTLFIGWANGAFSLENFFVEMVREAATEVPELIIITENDSNSNYVYSQLANAGTDMDPTPAPTWTRCSSLRPRSTRSGCATTARCSSTRPTAASASSTRATTTAASPTT